MSFESGSFWTSHPGDDIPLHVATRILTVRKKIWVMWHIALCNEVKCQRSPIILQLKPLIRVLKHHKLMDKVAQMLLNKFCLIWAAEDDNGDYLEEHTVIILKKKIINSWSMLIIIIIYVWPRFWVMRFVK